MASRDRGKRKDMDARDVGWPALARALGGGSGRGGLCRATGGGRTTTSRHTGASGDEGRGRGAGGGGDEVIVP